MSLSHSPTTSDDPDLRLADELAFLGFLTPEQRLCLPDWMVVGPPKTGTGWIYANLGEHPEAYVPPIKELKYFSNRFDAEDLRCYLSHFRPGIGKLKGEASPSYSILPVRTIRLIRRLVPDLKLIYLLRDPIDRGWSHARHNFRQREADFKGWQGAIDEVTDDRWIESLNHDWNRLSGDYLGQLQRWLSVFPRNQIYVGFFEDLARSPRQVLRNLLEFLGIDPEFSDAPAVTVDRVNPGVPKDLPPRVERHLIRLYGERTTELVAYLQRNFNLTPPAEWSRTLNPVSYPAVVGPAKSSITAETALGARAGGRLEWQVDDKVLASLLTRDDLFEMDFLGFNIIRRGERFLAYRMALGNLRADDHNWEWWTEQARAGNCLFAENPYDLKSIIVRHHLSETAPIGSESARLLQVELQIERICGRHGDMHSLVGDVLRRLGDVEHRQGERQSVLADVFQRLETCDQRQAQSDQSGEELRRSFTEALNHIRQRSQELDEVQQRLAEQFGLLQQAQTQLVAGEERLRSGHYQLDRELKEAQNRSQGTQIELLELKTRFDAWERSFLFRAYRWLCNRLAFLTARSSASEQARQQSVGAIVVRLESSANSTVADSKPMLPRVPASVISQADCQSTSG